MFTNYYCCSKFADFVRGVKKPLAATTEDWDKWEEEAKAKHPIRFWLAEEGLHYIQNVVYFIPKTINNIDYYLYNRFVIRSNSLTSRKQLEVGVHYDFGYKILPCLFDELINFVEVDCAIHLCSWGDDDTKKKYNYPTKWKLRIFHRRNYRNKEAGLEYLKWAAQDDKPEEQRIGAAIALELYNWWTSIRPNRPDAYEITGWTDYCTNKKEYSREQVNKMLEEISKIEDQYENEDTEMLKKLIEVRNYLWL